MTYGKGNNFNCLIEGEATVFWPPDTKSWLTGKDPDAGKDWGQENRATEDKMVGWHHQLKDEFEQTPGDSKRQWNLVYWGLWGLKESDMTEWLNTNK